MTAHADVHQPLPVAPLPTRRAGVAALAALAATLGALLVHIPRDVGSDAALHGYLVETGSGMFLAWVFTTGAGLAWLGFAVCVHRMLPRGAAGTLFLTATAAGQAVAWTGASLVAAPAAPGAATLPLSVYQAFAEAGHLADAAGSAAIGLSLVALAAGPTDVLGRALGWATRGVGAVMVLGAVVGPLVVPLRLLWLLVVGLALVMRSPDPAPSDPNAS